MDPMKNNILKELLQIEMSPCMEKNFNPSLPSLFHCVSDGECKEPPASLSHVSKELSSLSFFYEPNIPNSNHLPEAGLQISLSIDPIEPLCPYFLKQSSESAIRIDSFCKSFNRNQPQTFSSSETCISQNLIRYQKSKADMIIPLDTEINARKKRILTKPHKTTGSKSRSKYTEEEDRKICELVSRFGEQWKKIAKFMPGRDRKKLRDHYVNKIKHCPKEKKFTPEEDELILNARNNDRLEYRQIAKMILGCTNKMVRNRYNSLQVKRNNLDSRQKDVPTLSSISFSQSDMSIPPVSHSLSQQSNLETDNNLGK